MLLRLPVVLTERVVLPYSEATVTLSAPSTPEPGARVVLLRRDDGDGARIGALATVAATRRLDEDVVSIRLRAGPRAMVLPPVTGQLALVDVERSDEPGNGAQAGLGETRDRLTAYLAALAESGETASVHVDLPSDPVEASYRVASLVRVSDPELQGLLDVESAAQRLTVLSALLRRERRLLEETMAWKGT